MLNLDTHILIHALTGDLSTKERKALSDNTWSISAIVLWELVKLSQLKKIAIDLSDPDVSRTLSRIHTWPLTLEVCRTSTQLDFKGDPADEIIAATSMVHNVRLLTRDKQIRKSKLVPLLEFQ